MLTRVSISLTQYVGAPLYFCNKDMFYAWMATTKRYCAVVAVTMTYWWAPVKVRISGDESVAGQLGTTPDGRLECNFPQRMILMSNHQVRVPSQVMLSNSHAIDLHRLALPLVDIVRGIHARPRLHYPKGFFEKDSDCRKRYEVLQIHIFDAEVGGRQGSVPAPVEAAEPPRCNVVK
jgi:hypothetical protein